MKIKIAYAFVFIGYFISGSVFSAEPYIYDKGTISTRLEFGLLNGYAKEYLYAKESTISGSARKVSQLDWKIKNAPIIKYGVSYNAKPNITIDTNGWVTINKSTGYMDDYDWLDVGDPNKLTHHSWHSNTKLTRAYEIDLSVTGWALTGKNYKIGPVVGYINTKYDFETRGGSYWYKSGSEQGAWPSGLKVITYSQQMDIPYIGLVSKNAIGDFEIKTMIKYSPLAEAKVNDDHILRTLEFEERYRRLKYLALSFDTDYHVNHLFSVNLGVTHMRIKEKRTNNFSVIDYGQGIRQDWRGYEFGMSHNNTQFRIGLNMVF